MNQFADVALPVGIERPFTYLIPRELESSAGIGVRVVVPFGRSFATGLIVALPASSSVRGLKPLRDVIDAAPVLSPELMQLCHWVSDYYFAPLGEVLRTALPHGFSPPAKRTVRSTPAATSSLIEELRKHAPHRADILVSLAKDGPLSTAALQKKSGLKSINAVLNELSRSGLVKIEETFHSPLAGVRTRQFVSLTSIDDERIKATLASLPPRKKRARLLLQTVQALQQHGEGEISLAALYRKSGATSSTMREFRESGVLPVLRRTVGTQDDYGTEEETRTIVLNALQQQALDSIVGALEASEPATFLLHGVTGSGKTQVYIEAIRRCVQRRQTAIVLVPEISLTPQMVRRFKSHFAERVAVVHSRMSAGERREVWRLALRGDYSIVIGPRSAVFAPLQNLGLLVVDEEHEASYKQFDASPRYHARDVAIMRGTVARAVVLLGSATPSAESYHNAMSGKYRLLEMPHRIDQVPMPLVTIVDLLAERKAAYHALKETLPPERLGLLKKFRQSTLSLLLQEKIRDRLSRREGTILLQNRRGFAPFVECADCGYTEMCDNCQVTLTYHISKKHLRCHYCGLVRAPRDECPQCRGPALELHGIGTQRVEEELGQLFPEARVLRMDLDTTSRKGAHDRILQKFGSGEADILIGTQMVAKGLDFPRVTLVGVISADTQMLLPDFRASERTFQLLTQVAGRAGRSTLHGEVIVQTRQSDHFTLRHVVDHDFKAFYEQELEARRELDYPPFSRLVLVETKGQNEELVRRGAERFANLLKRSGEAFTLLGPSPAVIGKINNKYRWHILLKSLKSIDPSGSRLRSALRNSVRQVGDTGQRSVRLIIDVDPVGLM